MPTIPLSQNSFRGGEISEVARARVDLERYGESLKTARNTKIHVQGAISNRPGTIFGGAPHPVAVAPSDAGAQAVLVPFIVSESESYVLAFTDYIAQVWTSRSDGTPVPLAPVEADSPKITSIDSTGPAGTIVSLDIDHDFVNGQNIFISGAVNSTPSDTWETLNADINGAYPRYTVELVEDAALGSIPDKSTSNMEALYTGNYTAPCSIELDAAAGNTGWQDSAGSGVDMEGTIVDCWLQSAGCIHLTAGEKGTEFIELWEKLISPFGAGSTDRYRLSAHVHYQTATECAVEILWPGCTKPPLAGSTAVDTPSRWGSGDREVFPVLRLDVDMQAEGFTGGAGIANVFTLHPIDKRKIKIRELDATSLGSLSASTAALRGITQVRTPFSRDQAASIQYAQSLDVLTCVHPEVAPHDISRFSTFEWLCDAKRLIRNPPPLSLTATPNSVGDSHIFSYRVVSIDKATGVYSEAAQVDTATNAALSAGNDIDLSWEEATRERVSGYHVFRSDGNSAGLYEFVMELDATLTTATDKGPTDTVVGANIVSVESDGLSPMYTRHGDLFRTPGNLPTTVNYNNQRLLLAGTRNEPERVWVSRVGNYRDFNLSDNTADESAPIEFDLAVSTRLSSIFSSVALQQLILMTDAGEVSAGGGEGFASMTPLSGGLTLYPQSYYGAEAGIVPALADDAAIFVQKKGGAIRDIRYKADGLAGAAFGSRDLSVLASHLIEGERVTSLAFADSPDSVVYAITTSGALLAIAYSQEHGVVGFNRWDTGGITLEGGETSSTTQTGVAQNDKFLDVAVIPEGKENGVYFSVLRYPPSSDGRLHDPSDGRVFIERLVVNSTDRGIGFHNHVDCGMVYSVPIETNIVGAQVDHFGDGYEILQDSSPIAIGQRVDIFEKAGLRSSRNTSLEAYGQFAVDSTRTDANGLQWSKLRTPAGFQLGNLPEKVDILDLEVRFPVAQMPAEYITHGLKGTALPTANGSGWRPGQTYGLVANGMFYPDSDPSSILPAPSGTVQSGVALTDVTSQVLTSSTLPGSAFDKSHPSIDPTGQFVLFSMRKSIFYRQSIHRMGIDGSSITRLTSPLPSGSGGLKEEGAVYSPDGTRIAFVLGNGDIAIMDADGSNLVNTTNDGVQRKTITWNPAGTKIAFASNEAPSQGLWLIFIADTSPPYTRVRLDQLNGNRLVTNFTHSALDPAWSHDGTRIAFHSDDPGSAQFFGSETIFGIDVTTDGVATSNAYSLQAGQLTSGHVNRHPTWSADDQMFFYSSVRAGTGSDIFSQASPGAVGPLTELKIVSTSVFESRPSASHDPADPVKFVYEGEAGSAGNVEVVLRDGGNYAGAASHFYFGEPFTSEVETNPIRSEKIPDTAATKRIPQVGFRVTKTHSLNLSTDDGDPVEWVAGNEVIGHNGNLLYDGVGRVAVHAGSSRSQTVKVSQSKPHPFTLSGLYPEMEVDTE